MVTTICCCVCGSTTRTIRRRPFSPGLSAGILITRACVRAALPPAVWLAGERKQDLASVQAQHDALAIAEAQIAILQQLADASQGRARLCRTAAEIEQCLQQDVLALVMHIEGAEMLDPELALLDTFYQLGLRSIGPFWNLPNRFGVGVNGGFPGSPDTGDGMTEADRSFAYE